MTEKAQTTVRVRYAETDQMGIVYYANYLVWMEVARVEYCRQAGFDYRDMERESGVFLAVAEVRCRYRRSARFDDEVRLTCRLSECRKSTVRFAYEMHRGDELLATGETLHAVTDSDGKMIRMPEKYRRFFPISR